MKIKASGRLALMVATAFAGLLVGLTGPMPANAAGSNATAATSSSTTAEKPVRQSSRHGRREAPHRSSQTADKSESKKAAANNAGSVTSAGMPATVANANAELTSGDNNATATPAKAGAAVAAADSPADAQPAADGNVVASDQLNDVDRALQQERPAEQPPQAVEQETPPVESQSVAMASPKPAPVLASSDSSSSDQTSLIGKIFIGFGALLTVASAARMFMA